MRPFVLASLALATGAAAQMATFFAPYESALASIIASDATATTYLVGCPASQADVTNPANACNLPTPYTQIQGPNTVVVAITAPIVGGAFTATCKLQSTTSISCTQQLVGPDPTNSAVVATKTLNTQISGADLDALTLFRPISIVTDGKSLFGFVPAATTSSAPSSTSTASSTATSTTIPLTSTMANTTTPLSSTTFPSTTAALNTTTISSGFSNLTMTSTQLPRTTTAAVIVTANPTAPAATTVATSTRSGAGVPAATGSTWVMGGVALMAILRAL